jgi:glycerophosphoryl diester phosphodiesterase
MATILDDSFKVIIYRGGTEDFPENSLEAIKDSLREFPNAIIELDLQLTKDDEVIVFHDFHLEDLTNGNGLVAEHTFYQLQELFLKNPDKTISQSKISTLANVLALFPQQNFVLDLHEKNSKLFEKVIEIVETNHFEKQVVLVCIKKGGIKELQKLRPHWTYVASPQETKRFILLSKIGLQSLAKTTTQIMFLPNKIGRLSILSNRGIRELHKRNVKVWTCDNFNPYQNVNSLTAMEKYRKMNINGIYTDNAKRLK